MTEGGRPQRSHGLERLIDAPRLLDLSEKKPSWDRPGEVLQGIMDTRMGPPPAPVDHSSDNIRATSEFALKSPSSLLGLQLHSIGPETLDIRSHTSILSPWSPYQGLSPPKATESFFPSYSTRVSHNDQDAWTPLHVTGVPENPSVLGFQHPHKQQQRNESDRRFPYYQYSTPSEVDSQFNGFPPSDSGYGSKSCTTRSVVSTSYPVDSASSPQRTTSRDHHKSETTSAVNFHTSQSDNVSSTPFGMLEVPFPAPYPEEIKCDYPGCTWIGKCPSDKRKHEARHKKLFKCNEPTCGRKEGFGTINDLERHKKCVHNKEPRRGPKIMYMCFGRSCPRRNKKWPRLDNFRQHLARMHSEEDTYELLKKSEDWYGRWKRNQETSRLLVDPSPSPSRYESPPPQMQMAPTGESHEAPSDAHQDPCTLIAPNETMMNTADILGPSESLTLSPIKNIRSFDMGSNHMSHSNSGQSFSQQMPTEQQPVELPGLRSLNLPLDQEVKTLQQVSSPLSNSNRGRQSDIVAEAAMNVVDAMTKLMDSNQRKQSQATLRNKTQEAQNAAGLTDRKKEMLQKILSAALEQLGGQSPDSAATHDGTCNTSTPVPIPGTDYLKPWFECNICHKRTRLLCELKKHQKRHERPYGCTFPKCHKMFGSKADWKRHENSQHFHLQSWRCTLQDTTHQELECARLFYRQEIYLLHLTKHHGVKDDEVKPYLWKNRIGRNGQSQFWCGFCKKIIPLRYQGLEAWNERFNHIDSEHFKKGERIGTWVPPTGRLTKEEEREAERERKAEKRRNSVEKEIGAEDVSENDSTTNSSRASSCAGADDIPEQLSHPAETHSEDEKRPRSGREVSVELLDGHPSETPPTKPRLAYNQRKRKFSEDNLSVTFSTHTPAKKSQQEQVGSISNSTISAKADPAARATKTSTCPAKERREMAARLFYTRYARSEQQSMVYCCQCRQGPYFLELMTQCVTCPHALCDCCIPLTTADGDDWQGA